MQLEPIRIRIDDDGSKRRPDPPPQKGRGIGEFFNDLMTDVSEGMRKSARTQITRLIHDVDEMRPDTSDVEAYNRYRDMSDHLASLRDDIVNGGWKGASAARQVLSQFKDYDERPREERQNMLPRLQALMP